MRSVMTIPASRLGSVAKATALRCPALGLVGDSRNSYRSPMTIGQTERPWQAFHGFTTGSGGLDRS